MLDLDLSIVGLTPKEATVYRTLLELGTASVLAVARQANVVRPTTYVILESLAEKGLVSKATGAYAKKILFRAEPPECLESLLRRQARELEERREQLQRLLPDLRLLHLIGEERPRLRLFEGAEGLRCLQQEFIGVSRDSIVGMAPEDFLYRLFPQEEYNKEIRCVRTEARISSRHIYTSSAGVRYTQEEDTSLLRESRFVPPAQLPLRASISVHGPLLSIVSLHTKIIGVLIEHKDIADSFRAIFERMWLATEPPTPRG